MRRGVGQSDHSFGQFMAGSWWEMLLCVFEELEQQAACSPALSSASLPCPPCPPAVRRGDIPVLQAVAPTAPALEAASSDALLVAAEGPQGLVGAVRDTVCAMRQAHGYLGDESSELQVGWACLSGADLCAGRLASQLCSRGPLLARIRSAV